MVKEGDGDDDSRTGICKVTYEYPFLRRFFSFAKIVVSS